MDSDVDDVNLELTPPADEIRRSTGVVSPKVRLFNDVRVDLELVLAADNLNLQDFTFKFELRKFQNDLSVKIGTFSFYVDFLLLFFWFFDVLP